MNERYLPPEHISIDLLINKFIIKLDGRSFVSLLKDPQAEWPDRFLFTHVGRWEKGARNLQADIETVQRLLETAAQKLQAPDLDPKGVDGKIARVSAKSNTVAAIEAFQRHSNVPIDGLIEPSSQTWQSLVQPAGSP